MAVNTPLLGEQIHKTVRTGALSRLFGRSTPTNIWARLVRQLEVDYPQVLEEIIEDTESLSEDVVQRVIESVRDTDLSMSLRPAVTRTWS